MIADFLAAGYNVNACNWLVASAYGGFAVLTERGRRILRGIDRADSVGLDAHKWFFQPYEAGCLMVRDVSALEKPFGIRPDFLQDALWGSGHPNLMDRGLQMSRSARALKIWMSVQTFGMAAFRQAISNGPRLFWEEMVRDAVRCHFGGREVPRVGRLRFVREEVIGV